MKINQFTKQSNAATPKATPFNPLPRNAAPQQTQVYQPIVPPFRIVVDTREQAPYEFPDLSCEIVRKALPTGDYSIEGFESIVAIERKSEDDFLSSITHGHERFFREVYRLSRFPFSLIVVEADFQRFIYQQHSRRITPESILGNVTSIEVNYGVQVAFLSDRQCAQAYLSSLFVKVFAIRRNAAPCGASHDAPRAGRS